MEGKLHHTGYTGGVSPLYMFLYVVWDYYSIENISSWPQWYGVSLVCSLLWLFSFLIHEKVLPYWLNWHGVSSVCFFIWLFRLLLHDKYVLHLPHWYCIYVLSWACVLLWYISSFACNIKSSHFGCVAIGYSTVSYLNKIIIIFIK